MTDRSVGPTFYFKDLGLVFIKVTIWVWKRGTFANCPFPHVPELNPEMITGSIRSMSPVSHCCQANHGFRRFDVIPGSERSTDWKIR